METSKDIFADIPRELNRATRLGSMLLDHFVMTVVIMVFTIPGMIPMFVKAFKYDHSPPNWDFWGNNIYAILAGFALYFCKDSIQGRSVGKRVLKLQVVSSSGVAASPLRCFVRNIFCIIWPVEVLITLVNPNRRLGDLVAGTKVVPFNPSGETKDNNWPLIGISYSLSYMMMLALMSPYFLILSRSPERITVNLEKYNVAESDQLEKLLSDSLGYYGNPEARLFDSTSVAKLKYVSVIFRVKENYIEDDLEYRKLKDATTELVISRYSVGRFVGYFTFLYQIENRTLSTAFELNWNDGTITDEPH